MPNSIKEIPNSSDVKSKSKNMDRFVLGEIKSSHKKQCLRRNKVVPDEDSETDTDDDLQVLEAELEPITRYRALQIAFSEVRLTIF